MRKIFLVSALVLLGAFTRAVAAQETINYASLSGRVSDASGAFVRDATVSVRQTETNFTASAESDSEGRFRFPYLKVGPYEVTVHLQGFADVKRTLNLTLGSAFELPVTLSVGPLDTSVTVSAEATVLEASRSQIAGTVSQLEVQSVPLNGRNFLDLALLVPNVSPPNVGSTQLFAETSAVPGVGLSIGSQRNFSNSFIVDGLSANDDAAGLSSIPYGVDAVDQFQVVTSGGQAELGRALGGYVSIVTKSGTNVPHGEIYDYVRDDNFNAKNPLSPTKLPMSQKQFGGSLGGPIAKDRTFYFTNVERRLLDQTGLVTVSQDNINAVNARLSALGYKGAPVTTGLYPNPVHSTNVLVKIDHQFNSEDLFAVRYSVYDVTSSNSRGAGGINAPSASAALDNVDHVVAFSNTMTLSSRTVNETRAQFAYGDLQAPPTDPIGPAVSIAGIVSFGTLSGSPTQRTNKMYQVVNNLSHQRGAHALRTGVDLLYNDDTITYPRSIRGAYTFSTLENFLSGAYNNAGYTQTFGTMVIAQRNPNVGMYAQDEWKITSNFTLNAGVRYDLQFLRTINTDTNNVSPRVGFAWTPNAEQQTVVRGSAGIFYDRLPLRALANALLSAGNTTNLNDLRQISVSLSPTQDGAPLFPNILESFVPSITLPSLTTMDPNMKNAYSRQASLEVERRLGGRSTVSVGYQYVRGVDLIMSVNQNVPACIASGSNNGCRPNPNYANNSQYSPVASSNYHGLSVSFLQRPSSWGNYRVSYTLSRSMNNVSENFFSAPIDPTDISKDWGRSDDDQRHRLVINGAVHTSTAPATTMWDRFTYGFQLSGMLQAYSALPLNITSGVTTVQGTAGRPIVDGAFIPRNAGKGSDFFSLSLRLTRVFRLAGRTQVEGSAEAFNVTNRTNISGRIANFGAGPYPASPAANFGQITAVGDPRAFQFALRVRF